MHVFFYISLFPKQSSSCNAEGDRYILKSLSGDHRTHCHPLFCFFTETEVLSARGMFCCDRHEGHLVGLKQWRLRCPQLSQMFFVALVEIKGDKSAASETAASGPTIFKLLLWVLNEVWCAQLLLPVQCCELRQGYLTSFKGLWPNSLNFT